MVNETEFDSSSVKFAPRPEVTRSQTHAIAD